MVTSGLTSKVPLRVLWSLGSRVKEFMDSC